MDEEKIPWLKRFDEESQASSEDTKEDKVKQIDYITMLEELEFR